MTDHQDPQLGTYTKQEKTLFLLIVLIVIELNGLLIEEDGAGLLKGNTMLPLVLPVLPLIPFEP